MKSLEIFPGWKWRVSAGLAVVLLMSAAGCHKTATAAAQRTASTSTSTSGDPADANFAPIGAMQPGQMAGQNIQSARNEAVTQAQNYSQQPAPIERRAPSVQPQDQGAGQQQQYAGAQDGAGGQPDYSAGSLTDDQQADVLAADLTDESATDAPPPLPDGYDDQPVAPGADYLWTPGYWGYAPAGYFWVPGVWVSSPFVGALWTPGYWGFLGGTYRFHHGYWGPYIGFYGGINYGCGYVGTGFYGGYWNGGHFFYNTVVTRVGPGVRTVYSHPLAAIRTPARVSFWGGRGGISVRPTGREIAVMGGRRIPPMQAQVAVRTQAMGNRGQFYNVNRGRPAMAVAARPVTADRTLPAPLARPNIRPTGGPGGRGPAAAARPGVTPVTRPGPQAGPDRGPTPMHQDNRTGPDVARPQTQPTRPAAGPQTAPQNRQDLGGRPQQQPQVRPTPQQTQQQTPRYNGGQEQRPQPQQQPRPQPQVRQEPQQPRPQPQQQQPRPQPQQQMREAPPAPRPQPQPQHEAPRGEERR